jgi:hypothetical protein
MNPPLIMPFSVLNRIDLYRKTLRSKMPTTDPPTLTNGDDGGEKSARAKLKQLLVLEGVDEDAEGADATMRDELIMMARDDPIWMAELRKYLQQEEKEREEMRKERAVRLTRWRASCDRQCPGGNLNCAFYKLR